VQRFEEADGTVTKSVAAFAAAFERWLRLPGACKHSECLPSAYAQLPHSALNVHTYHDLLQIHLVYLRVDEVGSAAISHTKSTQLRAGVHLSSPDTESTPQSEDISVTEHLHVHARSGLQTQPHSSSCFLPQAFPSRYETLRKAVLSTTKNTFCYHTHLPRAHCTVSFSQHHSRIAPRTSGEK
jgi:hypothetical protein